MHCYTQTAMNDSTLWIVSLVCAYLLGSIPFGYLLVRLTKHEDIRDSGSGSTGATNVAHIFPVWLGFRGGKGVATALGVFLALTPFAAALLVVIFALVFAFTRYVSLASVIAALCYPVLAILGDGKHRLVVDLVYIAIPLIVILKHITNLRSLRNHTEPKFGQRASVTEAL